SQDRRRGSCPIPGSPTCRNHGGGQMVRGLRWFGRMRRRPDEPSQVRFAAADDLGDYAFHEMKSEDQWFVPEAPDGQSRWEALPESHPLSLAHLHRQPGQPAEGGIPPLPGPLKPPLLERRGIRVAAVSAIGGAFIGLIALGIGSTRAEPETALAAL